MELGVAGVHSGGSEWHEIPARKNWWRKNASEQLACSKIVRSPECEAKDWTLELALHLLQVPWKNLVKMTLMEIIF